MVNLPKINIQIEDDLLDRLAVLNEEIKRKTKKIEKNIYKGVLPGSLDERCKLKKKGEKYKESILEIDLLEKERAGLILYATSKELKGDKLTYPFAGLDFCPFKAYYEKFRKIYYLDTAYGDFINEDQMEKITSYLNGAIKFLNVDCNYVENVIEATGRIENLFWRPSFGGFQSILLDYIPKIEKSLILPREILNDDGNVMIKLEENEFKEFSFQDRFYELTNEEKISSLDDFLRTIFVNINPEPPTTNHIFIR